jgi:cell division protein FtsZ
MESTIKKMSVVGIGGAGCNTIDRLTGMGEIPYINTIAIDTDVMDLSHRKANTKILIGEKAMKGRGSGGKPEIAERAARKSEAAIKEAIKDSDIVFLTAGFGGGTGAGASSVVAQIAKEELGIITLVAYFMPFTFENKINKAWQAADKISKLADACLPIDNEKTLHIFSKDISANDAYSRIDDIILNLIKSISFSSSLDMADIEAIFKSQANYSKSHEPLSKM